MSDIAELTPTKQDQDGTFAVAAGAELQLQVMHNDGMNRHIGVIEAHAVFGVGGS